MCNPEKREDATIASLLNVFKIKEKINETVDGIIKFNPDILFSVDSPDFTLRVAKKVKKLKPKIKTIHFVAPKVYVWREHRVKELKSFLMKAIHPMLLKSETQALKEMKKLVVSILRSLEKLLKTNH